MNSIEAVYKPPSAESIFTLLDAAATTILEKEDQVKIRPRISGTITFGFRAPDMVVSYLIDWMRELNWHEDIIDGMSIASDHFTMCILFTVMVIINPFFEAQDMIEMATKVKLPTENNITIVIAAKLVLDSMERANGYYASTVMHFDMAPIVFAKLGIVVNMAIMNKVNNTADETKIEFPELLSSFLLKESGEVSIEESRVVLEDSAEEWCIELTEDEVKLLFAVLAKTVFKNYEVDSVANIRSNNGWDTQEEAIESIARMAAQIDNLQVTDSPMREATYYLRMGSLVTEKLFLKGSLFASGY
jgi:hypothetical protein